LDGANSVIRKDLEPGEVILWCARPNPWVAMDQPLVTVVVAIGVGAVSSFLLFGASAAGGGPFMLLAFLLLCLCLLALIHSAIAIINVWHARYAVTSRRLIVKTGLARPLNIAAGNIANLWSSSESIGSLTIEYRPLSGNATKPPPDTSRSARHRVEYCTLLAIQAPIMVETLIRKSLLARLPTTRGEAE
jgi:hypothetical protein